VDSTENRLIALLSRRDRAWLLDISESVELELGTVLCEPGESTRHVCFPIDCFISLVAAIQGVPALEVGMRPLMSGRRWASVSDQPISDRLD
jgi:hypothetical protein